MWQCCTRYSRASIGPLVGANSAYSACARDSIPRQPRPVFIFVGGIYARRVFWFSIFQRCFSFSSPFPSTSFLPFFPHCTVRAFSITLQHLFATSAEKGNRVKPHAWEILCTRFGFGYQWPRGSQVQLVPSIRHMAMILQVIKIIKDA